MFVVQTYLSRREFVFSWVSDARKPSSSQATTCTVIVAPIRRTLPRLLASGTIRICTPTNHRHFTARRVAAAVDQPWSNRSSRRLPVQVGRVSRSLLTFWTASRQSAFSSLPGREGICNCSWVKSAASVSYILFFRVVFLLWCCDVLSGAD